MTAKTFLAKIEAIAATSGKLAKLAIIKTFDETDRRMARAALDPTVTYYIAKLPTPHTAGSLEFDDIEWDLLKALSSRVITGAAAWERVQFSLHDLDVPDGEVLRRIILKDLRAGIGANSINTVFPGDIPDYSYMRCSLPKTSNIEKWDWSKGVFCQLKADGSFARVAVTDTGTLITTRQGNTYPGGAAMSKLMLRAYRTFNQFTETHGELTIWINGELQPRTIGNGMLNSLQQGGELPEGAEIRFDCWDQIPLSFAKPKGQYGVPYSERFESLTQQVANCCSNSIMLIESQIIYSKEEALKVYRGVLARKLEGVILKSPDMIWRDSTSRDSVKFKLEVDLDLKIVGFNPGEPGKRTEATFGSLRVQSEDGLLEADVAGFTREIEAYLHENRDSVLGKVLCVRANALSLPCESNDKHSLFHPRFIEVRSDKYRADSLDEVKAQFEAAIA